MRGRHPEGNPLPARATRAHHRRMPWTHLDSSAIDAARYDARAQQLFVRFTTGRVYRYDDVSPFVARALVTAPSPGEYFNEVIRDGFEYEEL